jgi:hypothetical protein
MSIRAKLLSIAMPSILILSACTTAKLEARLEANPQCKEVINPKTGALMPCPGTDKAFYRALGLEPAKPVPAASVTAVAPAAVVAVSAATSAKSNMPAATSAPNASPVSTSSSTECKPQLHKKTGGMLPCPSPD